MLPAQFVEKYGGRYRAFKAGWLIQCPFPEHRDSTPSCSVSGIGLFHCFGCGRKGHYAALLHDVAGYSWHEAYRVYRAIAELHVVERKEEITHKEPNVAELGFFDVEWNSAYDTYQQHKHELHRPPWSLAFDRGFYPWVLAKFQVGYDEKTQRLVIPVLDIRGQYRGYITRACIDSDIKYLVQPPLQTSTMVYNLHTITGRELHVFVAEGAMDVWYLTQLGFTPVVSVFGTHVSDAQRESLLRLHTRFTIIFDGDKAGRYGSSQVASRLFRAGAAVNVVETWKTDRNNLKDISQGVLQALIEVAPSYPSFREGD